MTLRLVCASALSCLALAACGGDKGTGPNARVFQIADVAPTPTVRRCASPSGGQASSDLSIDIRLVNTRSDSVTVQTIGMTGVVIRAGTPAEEALVGTPAYVRSTLPFSPSPAVLRPHDGEIVVRATLQANCASGSVDVQATVVVTTSIGQFVSQPFTVRHINP